MKRYLFMDTSGLMGNHLELKKILEDDVVFVICSTVLEELDKHKDGSNNEKRYKARKALHLINDNPDSVVYVVDEVPNKFVVDTLFYGFDMKVPDNKILYACYNFMEQDKSIDVVLLTNDNGMRAKADMLGLPSMKLIQEQDEEMYKGFIELYGTEEENDNALLELMESCTLHANQYVILHDLDTEQENAVRWDADERDFVDLKYRTTKVKPLNIYQECAMDLLYNDRIPIKVISGNYGSGKTLLTMKIMEEKMLTGLFDKMALWRNPIAVDGLDIGALPGNFWDKVGHFYSPMVQYLTNNTMYDDLHDAFDPLNEDSAKRRGYQLSMEVIQNLKGVSVDRTIAILDEAEDLSLKLIKVAGTRIGKGSMLVMMGDIKQGEDKYKYDNGLAAFVEQSKDEPLVGVIYLPEDVRSSVSKVFASLK